MAGIRKRLGSILGPEGRTPQFVEGQTTQLPSNRPAQIDLVKTNDTEYRMDFGIPQGVQGKQGLPGVNAVPADAAVAAYVSDSDAETRSAVDDLVLSRTKFSLAAGPASGMTVFVDSSRPYPFRRFGGYLWGNRSGRIWRSSNGKAWNDYAPSPDGSPVQIMHPVDGGEVVAATYTGIHKSLGWETGNVTWSKKLSNSGPGSNFQSFSLSATGTKAIAAEYGERADSRYAWISLDAGETWEVAYDAQERYTADQYAYTHIHGVEYDPWSDRFYLSEGHGEVAGIYVSEDDGATWVRPAGLFQNPSPTTLTATDDGLVCGSDSSKAGLFGIIRQENVEDEQYVETWRWRPGIAGVIGFGAAGHRDPETGVVYVAFRSAMPSIAPIIAGGTAGAGGLVYQWPTVPVGAQDDIKHAIVLGSEIYAHGRINGTERHFHGGVAAPGVPMLEPLVKVEGDNMAVGPLAVTESNQSTAIGIDSLSNFRSVAIGHSANARPSAVAIGYGTRSGSSSIAIGVGANNGTNGEAIAIGNNSSVTGGQALSVGSNSLAALLSVAFGHRAEAKGAYAVALGRLAEADGGRTAVGDSAVAVTGGDAFGQNTKATQWKSLALGSGTETTAAYQAHIGSRMLAAEAISTPVSPPPGTGHLFFREVDGKLALFVQFPTGSSVRLAIES